MDQADREAFDAQKCPHCPHLMGRHGHGGCMEFRCVCIASVTSRRVAFARAQRRKKSRASR